MDLEVFVVLLILPLLFALLVLMTKSILFFLFPFMGGLISAYTTAALGQSGDLTITGTTVLASAGTMTWNAVFLIPLMLTLICFLFAIARVLGRL